MALKIFISLNPVKYPLLITGIILLCGFNSPSAHYRLKLQSTGNQVIRLSPDTESLIRNPLNGWAIYATAGSGPDVWKKFDSIYVPALNHTVNAAAYASVLYIRMGWAQFEPAEGDYAWKKPGPLRDLIAGARARGLKLAFRINIDSRDKAQQCTPDYVRAAGAKGYTSRSGQKTLWSPYPDDPVFQNRYEHFIKALAADFNNPEEVDFVDGYGLGKWGESHSVNYLNVAHRAAVFNWVTDLYQKYFTNVPLVINYHRLIGTPHEWGAPDPDSRALLESAFRKGYALRHDAFGMTGYYQKFEKDIAAAWFPQRPIVVEGGWLHNGDGYLKDPRGFKNWGDVWQGEYDDAVEAHANVMDLRDIKETTSWFETAYALVTQFIRAGGYRLYPDSISVPVTITPGSALTITHRWRNLGIGVCPSNLPQYHQKYKVAFALLKDGKPVPGALWMDAQSDPSKWLRGASVSYKLKFKALRIPSGSYTWAVAIINTQAGNRPGINLAVAGHIGAGWVPLSTVTIK